MIRFVCTAAAVALATFGSVRTAVAEPENVQDLMAQMRSNVIMALATKDVDQLEEWAKTYRTTRSRAADGYWHLHYFHRTLAELPVSKDRTDTIQSWEELVKLWKLAHPESPTPNIVLASRYFAEAWAARGSGYAHKVFDDVWKVYRDNLEKARLVLLEAKPGAGADFDPEWYARMAQIGLSLGDRRSRFMAVVEEGLKREPTYYKLYNVAFIYLLPKWHGSAEDAEAWARTAAERTRETEGNSMYARIYANHLREADARETLDMFAIDWPRMKIGIDDLMKRDVEPEMALRLLRLSCAAKDAEQVTAIWKRLGAEITAYRHAPIDVSQTCGWKSTASAPPPLQPEPKTDADARIPPTPSAHFMMWRPGPGQYVSN